jgi:hypothetical protein
MKLSIKHSQFYSASCYLSDVYPSCIVSGAGYELPSCLSGTEIHIADTVGNVINVKKHTHSGFKASTNHGMKTCVQYQTKIASAIIIRNTGV